MTSLLEMLVGIQINSDAQNVSRVSSVLEFHGFDRFPGYLTKHKRLVSRDSGV